MSGVVVVEVFFIYYEVLRVMPLLNLSCSLLSCKCIYLGHSCPLTCKIIGIATFLVSGKYGWKKQSYDAPICVCTKNSLRVMFINF